MLERLQTLLPARARRGDGHGSVTSFRETFVHRPRSGSAEFLFAEIRNAFDPNSRFIRAWQQLVLLCILYELFILPYIVVFTGVGSATASSSSSSSHGHRILSSNESPSPTGEHADDGSGVGLAPLASMTLSSQRELVMLYVCEIIFCIDIYVQLNTGYYEDGNVLRDTRKSRLKYLKSWAFVMDIAALPPLALMLPVNVATRQYRACLELHKLLRVRRLPKLIANLDDLYARYFVLLKLGKVLVTTLFVSHVVACGRFTFGYDVDHTNHWLPKAPVEEHTPRRRYLMSLFWAFGMLTGLFEGELPHSAYEFGFSISVSLCGFSLFTYLCATFFFLSKCEGGENETAEARVNQFKHLLSFHRVPQELQNRAVGYLKRYYAQAEANDRGASKLLCPSITVDIQIELLQETVATIPVFKGCDSQFIKAVTSLLDTVSYPAQFVLFRAGDHGDAMYVIQSGVVSTLVNGEKVRELRKGAFFGEVAVFANLPRSATMVTATYCTLYRLSRLHTDNLMEGYPRFAKLIRKTVDDMRNAAPALVPPKADEQPNVQDVPLYSAAHRKSTRASFMEAIGMKGRQSEKRASVKQLTTNAVGSEADKSRRRTTVNSTAKQTTSVLGPNVEKVRRNTVLSSANIGTGVRSPSEARIAVAETVKIQPAREGSSPPVSANTSGTPRHSLARHLSWRDTRSSKVTPTTSAPEPKLLHRRSSVTDSLLAGQMRATLVHKSRSQLELLKNSLMRLGRGSIDSVRPDAMKGFYDHIQRMTAPADTTRRWWSPLLLRRCINAESRLRMAWLVILQLDLCYNWILIPLQLSFPLFDRPRWYITMMNVIADVVLWVDVYANMNLSFAVNSEMIFDTTRSAEKYIKSGHLLADIACAFPYEWVVRASISMLHVDSATWAVTHAAVRIPRLLRVWRIVGHFAEVEEFFVLKSKQRLLFFGFLLTMLYHIVACLHFSITYWEGFSSSYEAWIPSDDIYLDQVNSTTFVDIHSHFYGVESDEVSSIQTRQYFRSLYYATNVLAALGKTIEPSSDRQYGIALLFMLSGFLITAIVVDNVQKRFTASALEQKEFFATRARIQLFLKRQEAPLPIHQRVNSFLDYWWSSHRGAIIGELLDELPETIKRDIIRSICKPAVESIGMLFPQIWTEEKGRAHHEAIIAARIQVEDLFLDNLKFVLYGQSEVIYRRGDYPSGIYFLLEGQICVDSGSTPSRRIPIGGFFGTAALDGQGPRNVSQSGGHKEQVTALSGSIVVYLPREHLSTMQSIYPDFASALRASEKRLHVTSRKKAGEQEAGITKTVRPGALKRSNANKNAGFIHWFTSTKLWKICVGEECFDPDSSFIGFWEVWVFVAMTAQSTMVIYHTCYGVDTGTVDNTRKFVTSDAIIMFLEGCFLVDIFIRTRLGFYEYGNKVMSLRQIKAHYIGSKYFMIDILAVLPFFLINWVGSISVTRRRLEIVNANKLLRLLKSSSQFRALDAKHVRRTFELRLFRLVYYTFLASHTFGCIWFDFAAHNSGIYTSDKASFGENRWLPYEQLEQGSRNLQYFASIFWSFGLMTASSTGELPKTVSQCAFSVVTMTTGFFLFAYVVGNFLDVFELQDSDNRHFIANLSSLRHLLRHFKLPAGIEAKFKTYFFFKRFHSITQEHVLERVLPPSLLVDIRMFQLQPMIVKVAFLAGMEDSVTRMLVSQFTQMLVVKDMYICKFGEEGKEMFFIFTGVLDIYIPLPPGVAPVGSTTSTTEAARPAIPVDDTFGLLKVNQITAGSYFGEAALFTKAPRNAYVKARTSCILYRLSRESLELVFERFPEWKEKVLRIVAIQQEQQRLMRLAAQAQEEDPGGPSGSPGKRRSLRRTLSRIDLINSRAEDMEELVLTVTRGGRGSHFSPVEWIAKKGKSLALVKKWLKPVTGRLRHWLMLMINGAEVQSPFYLFWLHLVTFSTVYLALIVPYRCAYDDLERWTTFPVLARTLESLCEIVIWWDVWFHFRIQDSLAAMELYEQDHSEAYKRERLLWDVLAAFPLEQLVTDQFAGAEQSSVRRLLRLNRCFKVANLSHYRLEVNRRSVTYERNRLVTLSLLYLLMMYWTSCTYIAVALHAGFGDDWQAWLPSKLLYDTDDTNILLLRFLRGSAFAVTAFVKKAKTFTPTLTLTHAFTVVVSFVGQLIMAFMIGEIATLYMLYIDNEVVYRKNHIAVEHFMSRRRLSPQLKLRCNAFLTSWWSSHAGVDYQAIFDDLPPTVRTEGIAFIARTPLNKFMDRVFRPLTDASGGSPLSTTDDEDMVATNADVTVENLMHTIAQHLHFEGYPRGEDVVVEGRVCRAVFFVVRGNLFTRSASNPSLYHAMRYRPGDYFGEKGLLGHSVSLFTVSTIRACDLFVLRAEHLLDAIKSQPYFSVILRMAQEIVREKITLEVYFQNKINKDRRELLHRRLSAPLLSNAPTPNLSRPRSKSKRSIQALDASPTIQEVLQQSGQREWEEAFAQFMQLLIPKGTLNVSAGGDAEDVEVPLPNQDVAPRASPRPGVKRSRTALMSPSSQYSGLSGISSASSNRSMRTLRSPSPSIHPEPGQRACAPSLDDIRTSPHGSSPCITDLPPQRKPPSPIAAMDMKTPTIMEAPAYGTPAAETEMVAMDRRTPTIMEAPVYGTPAVEPTEQSYGDQV